MYLILFVLLLLAPSAASAEAAPWLKKENPHELPVYVFSSEECPLSADDARDVTMSVLIRSRIKPIKSDPSFLGPFPYLSVQIECMDAHLNGKIVGTFAVLMIEFANQLDLNDPHGERDPFSYGLNSAEVNVIRFRYGTSPHLAYLSTTSGSSLRSEIRDSVEDFMVDYLKVNFDLGD